MTRSPMIPMVWAIGFVMMLGSVIPRAIANELVIVFHSGRRIMARLDPRTDASRLWLKFGTERVRISHNVPWDEIAAVYRGDEELAPSTLQRMAVELAEREPKSDPQRHEPGQIYVAPGSTGVNDSRRAVGADWRSGGPHMGFVRFDVTLANWDDDVELDGLLIDPQAFTAEGVAMNARGTLHVTLWSMRRVDQDAVPRSRGRSFEPVGRWAVTVEPDRSRGGSRGIQLPFREHHPEFDTDWSPLGVVHIKFAVPGHGEFHHSEEGVRIRRYSAVRDYRELADEPRFFAGENRGGN